MIDWITALKVPCTHNDVVLSGLVLEVDINGETKWETMKRLSVKGSYDATIQVRTSSTGTPGKYIEISGNPSKFLQGHNIFGSNDLRGIAASMIRGIIDQLPQLTPTEDDLRAIDQGDYDISRIDINETFHLANRKQVKTAIATLANCSSLSHRPGKASLTGETTCYYGKNSGRWALKIYCKGDEIERKNHELPDELKAIPSLVDYADRALRVELVLRGKELKETKLGLHRVANWGDNTAEEVFCEYLSRLKISDATMINATDIEGLAPRLRSVYQLWLDGHDIRQMFPKATFYRYRSELLKHGVDISNLHHQRTESNVIPIGIVLHARPAGVPDWAIGTPLYFEPKARSV